MARQDSQHDAARRLAVTAARAADRYNAEDVVVLDLRQLSPVTRYFVIATGTSRRQLRATADEIARAAKAGGEAVWRTAGLEACTWVLLDFVDVVVHLFDEQHRSYYDLELIWGEAPRVDWSDDADGTPGEAP
ncbi:MAG: ribosome silencing factor [Phycisphaerae bacterium]|nr:ribosome silencing factor [Phycisphaerae bacterium]